MVSGLRHGLGHGLHHDIPTYQVETTAGTVTSTEEHPFYVHGKGWTPVRELQPGDRLVDPKGTHVEVITVQVTGQTATVYNINVDHLHTYHVRTDQDTWIRVHNQCTPLTREEKDLLRADARDIWQNTHPSGRRAIWDSLQVHHRIPLEWDHLMPGNPNRLSNLVGMRAADHSLVTQEWNAWRRGLNGATPSPADIMQKALDIDRKFGHQMRFPSMTAVRSYAQVLDLLRRVPRPPEAAEVVGATDKQLAALEARVQQQLPAELREWLAVCNGAIAGPGLLLGAGTSDPDLDIGFNQSLWPEWQERRWLPVATDGAGNGYVLTTSDAKDPANAVYFVDCSEDPGSLAYVGASSLIHFLVFLLEKELGESRWPFDAGYVTEQDPAIMEAIGAPLPWTA